jgi:hypothetical protein
LTPLSSLAVPVTQERRRLWMPLGPEIDVVEVWSSVLND